MTIKTFDDLFEEAEQHDDYWAAGVVQDFTEELTRWMEAGGISRSELARRIDSSPAYITKILRGNTNFTIVSMVRLARAVGAHVRIELAPRAVFEDAPRTASRSRAPRAVAPYEWIMERDARRPAVEAREDDGDDSPKPRD